MKPVQIFCRVATEDYVQVRPAPEAEVSGEVEVILVENGKENVIFLAPDEAARVAEALLRAARKGEPV